MTIFEAMSRPVIHNSLFLVMLTAYMHTVANICSILHHYNIKTNILFSLLTNLKEPQTYEDIVVEPTLLEAMQKEFEVLVANQTWELVYLPPS